MKNLIWLMFGLVFSLSGQAQTVIKLCYEDATYFPWQLKDGHGLDNNLLEMAAIRSGVKIEMQALPWKRCLADIGYGLMAGGFSASYNQERASFAAYPMAQDKPDAKRRVRTDGYSLFRLVGSPVSWDGRQIQNLSGPVGAQLGYSVAADLRKLGADVEESPGVPELQLRKLLVKRVQLAALLTVEGDALLDDAEFAGKIEKLSTPLTEKPYFLIINRDYYEKNKKSVDDLWAAVATVRDSAEFRVLKNAALKKGPPKP
jgi:polar amino acid transport system substrate-binding protein